MGKRVMDTAQDMLSVFEVLQSLPDNQETSTAKLVAGWLCFIAGMLVQLDGRLDDIEIRIAKLQGGYEE